MHYVLYIRLIRAPPLGVEFCRAGDAHIAARLAPVAPQGEIQTLGEHGLLCGEFGPTRAPRGAFLRVLAVVKLSADARIRTPLARLPEGQNGVRTAPIPLRF